MFAGVRTGVYATTSLPTEYDAAAEHLSQYHVTAKGYVYMFNIIQPNFAPHTKTIGGLLNDLYIRQAMQIGINEPRIAKVFYRGFAVPDYTVVARLPQTLCYDSHMPVYYPYDPAQGKKLLEAHGWHEVNGVMTKGSQSSHSR